MDGKRHDQVCSLCSLCTERRKCIRYSPAAIRTPLTKISLELTKALPNTIKEYKMTCVSIFKDLLQYMHGAKLKAPLTPSTILQRALAWMTVGSDEVRAFYTNEIYCQLLKQLTDCPFEVVRTRGWQALFAAVQTVPPAGEEMQCVVEAFCLRHSNEQLRSALHRAIFAEPGDRVALLAPEAVEMKIDCVTWDDADQIMPSCFCCC